MRYVDIQALSVDEAVRLALEQLGRSRDQVKVEVLARDPGGDEVLVRVTTIDPPSAGAPGVAEPGNRFERPDHPEREQAPGRRFDRADRPPQERQRFDRGPRVDRPGRDQRFDRQGARPAHDRPPRRPEREPEDETPFTGVSLDESLEPSAVGAGEHATPQDAVAPLAAEILQKMLTGMRTRGRIVRREPSEEGEAAFPDDQESLILNVVGLNERDQSLLVGRRGETLDALQFLVNLILGRQSDLWVRVIIDVEGYRLRRKLALMNLARRTADQVQARSQAIPLEAMPAYERRIIHLTLAEHPAVTTESTGVEPERRVVVLPR